MDRQLALLSGGNILKQALCKGALCHPPYHPRHFSLQPMVYRSPRFIRYDHHSDKVSYTTSRGTASDI